MQRASSVVIHAINTWRAFPDKIKLLPAHHHRFHRQVKTEILDEKNVSLDLEERSSRFPSAPQPIPARNWPWKIKGLHNMRSSHDPYSHARRRGRPEKDGRQSDHGSELLDQ
jgi:hypothetical protein